MTKEQLVKLCLEMPGSFVDNPYGPTVDVLKNRVGKSFALVGILGQEDKNFIKKNFDLGAPVAEGDVNITLKCPPVMIYSLRDKYKAVVPGYYSNKDHWNTVILNKDVPDEEIKKMIMISYDLVTPQKKK